MQSEKINIIIFISLTTGLILLMGLIIILVIYLYQQKKIIHTRSITELQLSHERKISATHLEVQENIFRHISQEIHDNVGLMLSLVKLRLNTLNFSDTNTMKQQVESSVNLLGDSINHLRDISQSLNSEIIKNYGLVKAIEHEIHRVNDLSEMQILLLISGEIVYLDSQKELIIFRIVQEALNNILKHSGTRSAAITLTYKSNELIVVIKDEGKGFQMPLNSKKAEGSGFTNMTARSRLVRASMDVSSIPSKGTTLTFIIPT